MMATPKQVQPREYPDARRNKPTRSNARSSGFRRHAKRIAPYARLRAVFVRPGGTNSFSRFARTLCRVQRSYFLFLADSARPSPVRARRAGILLHQKRCREPVLPQQSAFQFRAAEILPMEKCHDQA